MRIPPGIHAHVWPHSKRDQHEHDGHARSRAKTPGRDELDPHVLARDLVPDARRSRASRLRERGSISRSYVSRRARLRRRVEPGSARRAPRRRLRRACRPLVSARGRRIRGRRLRAVRHRRPSGWCTGARRPGPRPRAGAPHTAVAMIAPQRAYRGRDGAGQEEERETAREAADDARRRCSTPSRASRCAAPGTG